MVRPTKAEVQTERLAAIKARHANDVDQAWAFDDIAWLVSRADENERLRSLLRRLFEWDHMASAADGPYWRSEIEKALGNSKDG